MAVAQQTAIQGIDIAYFLVKDVDRAKKFWQETMGLTMTKDYGPNGGEFTFGDDTTFGLWKGEDEWHPGGGVMLRVGDVKEAVALYKSRGVKFDDDGAVMDTTVCHMAFGEDSEGNHFILHKIKD